MLEFIINITRECYKIDGFLEFNWHSEQKKFQKLGLFPTSGEKVCETPALDD
jgi:hypothetical protein